MFNSIIAPPAIPRRLQLRREPSLNFTDGLAAQVATAMGRLTSTPSLIVGPRTSFGDGLWSSRRHQRSYEASGG